MKKIFLTAIILFTATAFSFAQKFAFVDTEYILKNIPEYNDAQAQLDELSVQWQKEIEAKFTEIDKMYKDFQAEVMLLPADAKQKKEDAIVAKEKEAKDLQKKRFGKDGDLSKKREELVKPLQEKIYNAIEELSTDGGYAVIFDKSGSLTMLYSNPKYDLSDNVLDKMGYTYTKKTQPEQKSQSEQKNSGTKQKK
ncbi:MAG TPA: OmpH family outer membrane protein [Bacteroidales bacterium]|jgi:outer membrane protein|nr:OmpH family outer membrane protein [Bacteroidales bacterium]HPT03788.1 OmpH family outer membrane protein [Bacteroidales bacterium]